ncbi:MAG: hypothetical protein PHV13_03945, partial [Candidatus ainarchaeum sp.]|nr:hypothetical protein [Candidatus ainarchaeum sp.]
VNPDFSVPEYRYDNNRMEIIVYKDDLHAIIRNTNIPRGAFNDIIVNISNPAGVGTTIVDSYAIELWNESGKLSDLYVNGGGFDSESAGCFASKPVINPLFIIEQGASVQKTVRIYIPDIAGTPALKVKAYTSYTPYVDPDTYTNPYCEPHSRIDSYFNESNLTKMWMPLTNYFGAYLYSDGGVNKTVYINSNGTPAISKLYGRMLVRADRFFTPGDNIIGTAPSYDAGVPIALIVKEWANTYPYPTAGDTSGCSRFNVSLTAPAQLYRGFTQDVTVMVNTSCSETYGISGISVEAYNSTSGDIIHQFIVDNYEATISPSSNLSRTYTIYVPATLPDTPDVRIRAKVTRLLGREMELPNGWTTGFTNWYYDVIPGSFTSRGWQAYDDGDNITLADALASDYSDWQPLHVSNLNYEAFSASPGGPTGGTYYRAGNYTMSSNYHQGYFGATTYVSNASNAEALVNTYTQTMHTYPLSDEPMNVALSRTAPNVSLAVNGVIGGNASSGVNRVLAFSNGTTDYLANVPAIMEHETSVGESSSTVSDPPTPAFDVQADIIGDLRPGSDAVLRFNVTNNAGSSIIIRSIIFELRNGSGGAPIQEVFGDANRDIGAGESFSANSTVHLADSLSAFPSISLTSKVEWEISYNMSFERYLGNVSGAESANAYAASMRYPYKGRYILWLDNVSSSEVTIFKPMGLTNKTWESNALLYDNGNLAFNYSGSMDTWTVSAYWGKYISFKFPRWSQYSLFNASQGRNILVYDLDKRTADAAGTAAQVRILSYSEQDLGLINASTGPMADFDLVNGSALEATTNMFMTLQVNLSNDNYVPVQFDSIEVSYINGSSFLPLYRYMNGTYRVTSSPSLPSLEDGKITVQPRSSTLLPLEIYLPGGLQSGQIRVRAVRTVYLDNLYRGFTDGISGYTTPSFNDTGWRYNIPSASQYYRKTFYTENSALGVFLRPRSSNVSASGPEVWLDGTRIFGSAITSLGTWTGRDYYWHAFSVDSGRHTVAFNTWDDNATFDDDAMRRNQSFLIGYSYAIDHVYNITLNQSAGYTTQGSLGSEVFNVTANSTNVSFLLNFTNDMNRGIKEHARVYVSDLDNNVTYLVHTMPVDVPAMSTAIASGDALMPRRFITKGATVASSAGAVKKLFVPTTFGLNDTKTYLLYRYSGLPRSVTLSFSVNSSELASHDYIEVLAAGVVSCEDGFPHTPAFLWTIGPRSVYTSCEPRTYFDHASNISIIFEPRFAATNVSFAADADMQTYSSDSVYSGFYHVFIPSDVLSAGTNAITVSPSAKAGFIGFYRPTPERNICDYVSFCNRSYTPSNNLMVVPVALRFSEQEGKTMSWAYSYSEQAGAIATGWSADAWLRGPPNGYPTRANPDFQEPPKYYYRTEMFIPFDAKEVSIPRASSIWINGQLIPVGTITTSSVVNNNINVFTYLADTSAPFAAGYERYYTPMIVYVVQSYGYTLLPEAMNITGVPGLMAVSLNLSNTGNQQLNVSFSTNQSFMVPNQTSISIAPYVLDQPVWFIINTTGLAPNYYMINVTASEPNAGNKSSILNLSLAPTYDFSVQPPLTILYSTPFNVTPSYAYINVTNTGNIPIDLNFTVNQTFATLNVTNVTALAVGDMVQIEVMLNVSTLNGTRFDVNFTASNSSMNRSALIRLMLNTTPTTCILEVSPSSISFGTMAYDSLGYSNLTLSNTGTLDGNLTVGATNFTTITNVTLASNYTRRTADPAYSASYGNMTALFGAPAAMGALNSSVNSTDYLGLLAPPPGTPGLTYTQTITYTLDCG